MGSNKKNVNRNKKTEADSKGTVKNKTTAQTEKNAGEKEILSALRREKIQTLITKISSSPFFVPAAAVFCFLVICAVCYLNKYKIFSPDFSVTGLFHCLYVGDFSIGISSRLLAGSIISLFTDTVTADAIDTFARVFLIASFALQSVFAALVMKKGLAEKNVFMLLLAAIFIVSPLTVCAYTYFYGVLDLYNYFLFMIAMVILIKGKSNIQLTVTLLSVAGLLMHNSYFLAFFPSLFVIGLYRTVNSEGRALKKEAAALGIHSVVSVGGFFYLTLFAKNHLFMTADEMSAYVLSKTDTKSVFVYDDYLRYYLYDIFKGTQMEDTGSSLSALININSELVNTEACIKYLVFSAPVLLSYYAICLTLAVKAKGAKKLPFIAACVMPLALVPELILSSDSWRWIAGMAICLFFVLFSFYLTDDNSLKELLEGLKQTKRPVRLTLTVLPIVYFLWCFVFEHVTYG